jgi:predicted lysophospholipase L1 biosynthesis ABC-type transport system permease subunit
MVAIDHHSALGVRRKPVYNFRKGSQRKPFMAVDPANRQLVALAAIDQAWPLVGRQVNPLRNHAGADFERELRIRK